MSVKSKSAVRERWKMWKERARESERKLMRANNALRVVRTWAAIDKLTSYARICDRTLEATQ